MEVPVHLEQKPVRCRSSSTQDGGAQMMPEKALGMDGANEMSSVAAGMQVEPPNKAGPPAASWSSRSHGCRRTAPACAAGRATSTLSTVVVTRSTAMGTPVLVKWVLKMVEVLVVVVLVA